MKRLINIILLLDIALQFCNLTYANNEYTQGTQVTYDTQISETYTVTVPAHLHPGDNGDVIAVAKIPSNKVLKVVADEYVELTSNIDFSNFKILDILFDGIQLQGNNKVEVTQTKDITVEDMSGAIFGTWSGHFNYYIDIAENNSESKPNLPNITNPDGVTLVNDASKLDESLDYVEIPYDLDTAQLLGYESGELIVPAAFYVPNTSEIALMTFASSDNESEGTWYKVTSISDQGFSDCEDITTLSLPGTIEYIGDEAFSNCTSLSKVKLSSDFNISNSNLGTDIFYVDESLIPVENEGTLPTTLTGSSDEMLNYDWGSDNRGYNITIIQSEGGTLTASETRAINGKDISFNAEAESERFFDNATIKYGNSKKTLYFINNTFEMPTSNVTITPEFINDTNSYTIIFDGNGSDDGIVYSKQFDYNTIYSINNSEFKSTKTGYSMSGWSTTPDGDVVYHTSFNRVIDRGQTITLYAVWTPKSYTIGFKPNGGTGTTVADIKATYDTTVTIPSTAKYAKTGYIFKGWNTKSDGTGKSYKSGDSVKNLSSDVDKVYLYAQYTPITYTVTFKPNGGTNISEYTQTFKYNETQALTPNKFTREGYAFKNWLTVNNSSGIAYSNEQRVANLKNSDGANLNLYAQWTGLKYIIHYNGYGNDSGTMADTSHVYGTSSKLRTNTFKCNGYTFTGWSTYAGGEKEFTDGDSISKELVPKKDSQVINLWAVWKINNYRITLDRQGGSGGSGTLYARYKDGYYTSTSEAVDPITEIKLPSKIGYTFEGYYTKPNGEGTYVIGWQGNIINSLPSYLEDTTLYAHWTPNTYTVNFEANTDDYSGYMNSITLTYDEATNLPKNNYYKEGYTFKNWNTYKNGGSTYYNDQASVKNLKSVQDAELTLYAQWKANKYTINYHGNGADDGTMTSSTFTYDTQSSLRRNTFTKVGHKFMGWTLEGYHNNIVYENYEKVLNLASEDGAVIDLYAVWDYETYSIRLDKGSYGIGGTSYIYVHYNTAFIDGPDFDEANYLGQIDTPTRSGYIFNGYWTATTGGEQIVDSNGFIIVNEDYFTDDGVIYSQWIKET